MALTPRALIGASFTPRLAWIFLAALTLAGCGTFNPQPIDTVDFKDRVTTSTQDGVTISAVALGPQEAQAVFGRPLFSEGIQPVWVEVENNTTEDIFLMQLFFDPLHYTPAEAAFISHISFSGDVNTQIDAHFEEHGLEAGVKAGTRQEGFLFVTPDLGAKVLNFVFVGDNTEIDQTMVVVVPGLAIEETNPSDLYGPDDITNLTTRSELWAAIEALPCCVTDATGTVEADPLNFVLIGTEEVTYSSLIAAGWDETETVTSASAVRTTMSFLFGSAYRYSPISDLYVFGRKQDGAFQITRADIDERNHLRVWLTPLQFQGRPVWVGAISRDIGVIMSGIGTTHKIDPDVDAERWYLAQSFARAQALSRIGYAPGGPVSLPDNPRSSVEPKNIFYSDGERIVLELSDSSIGLDEIDILAPDELTVSTR